MSHWRGERASGRAGGFSAKLELAEIQPLLTLIRCLGCDAELRVRGTEGSSGDLRYAAGQLTSGSFDGVSGPLAIERLLALRAGALELEVLPRAPSPELPAPSPAARAVQPAQLASWAEPEQPAADFGANPGVALLSGRRHRLWMLAPGLAIGLWLAAELVARLSGR